MSVARAGPELELVAFSSSMQLTTHLPGGELVFGMHYHIMIVNMDYFLVKSPNHVDS